MAKLRAGLENLAMQSAVDSSLPSCGAFFGIVVRSFVATCRI